MNSSPYNRVILLEDNIKIKWVFRTSGYWKSKGYEFTGWGDEFEVSVFDLEPGSGKTVRCCCPMCGAEKETQWRYLLKWGHSKCMRCSFKEDLFSRTFGRLTVLRLLGVSDSGDCEWLCECLCGSFSVVKSVNLVNGHTKSCGCYKLDVAKRNLPPIKRGPEHHNWNPALTNEDRDDRRTVEYLAWAKAVYARERYKCAVCNKRTRKPEAHHLNCWKHFPEQRYDINNGIAVCRECHTEFHVTFLGGHHAKCTKNDFIRFLIEKQKSLKPLQSLLFGPVTRMY